MDVLVVTVPATGHLLPMVPLVEALVADGDRVTVATNPSLSEPVERAGARLWPAGSDEATWFERLAARTRGAPGDGLAAERIDHYFVPRIFGEIGADDMVDDVLACADARRPDLVVFESYAFAGPLVAARTGVPGAQHLLGSRIAGDVLGLVDDAVSPLWRSLGLHTPGYAGCYAGATIEICPPSLADVAAPGGTTLRVRPAPPPAPARPRTPPLVYVTLGTVFTSPAVIAAALEALASEPVEVVCTLPSAEARAAVGEPPANARVEAYVPQGELLPSCSAVVHHGGAGTMFGSLAHGLPQVVVPQGADNFRNAALVAASGASVTVPPDGVSDVAIRDAVRAVLDDPSYRAAAGRLAAEIARMPSPSELADALRAWATAT